MASWEPTAPIANLKLRAELLRRTREFFHRRDVLEIETPLLGHHSVTDPHIDSFQIDSGYGVRYLQSSPEYAMKRLLAAGSGSIYQICKAFRDGEAGRMHNPEFTLVEWYRVGFTVSQLIDEVDEFVQELLGTQAADRQSFGKVFENRLAADPFTASIEELAAVGKRNGCVPTGGLESKLDWLDWLMAAIVQPELGAERPLFLYDYPSEMAMLSKVRPGPDASREDEPNGGIASRFELYFRGVELANGFHELQDAKEQRRRFDNDRRIRATLGKSLPQIDFRVLDALVTGLPDCSGVALGFDRLTMLGASTSDIADVVAFDWSRS